ncbi:MAG TPA: hypothetical protein PKZ75_15375 [Bacteroidia bacterium]|jgi:hypothetical protein|nr:hypothetical protein [Bacteroidia bacterium]
MTIEKLENKVKEIVDWSIAKYGFDVAFEKSQNDISGLALDYLNSSIAFTNKIQNDSIAKDAIFKLLNKNN